jgi:hypothetical protein
MSVLTQAIIGLAIGIPFAVVTSWLLFKDGES